MERVFEWVMLSRPDVDAKRFMQTIDDAISKGGWRGRAPDAACGLGVGVKKGVTPGSCLGPRPGPAC
jgi:hypothetical protein